MNISLGHETKKFIRLIAIVVTAAVLGIFLGRLVSSYEMRFMLSREYCGTYRGIDVYKSGHINDSNFLGHIYKLKDAPEKLVECCDTMYFTEDDLPIPDGGTRYSTALGLTQNRTVYISTYTYYPEVVIHELFHAYDYSNGLPSENSYDFKEALKSEKGKLRILTGVAGSYEAEYFATAGALYVLSPDVLMKAAPKTYKYFDSLDIMDD